MITDLKAFLEADVTLAALLYATAGNTKIFYLEPEKGETSPWVTIGYSSDGTADDLLDDAVINIGIAAEEYTAALAIAERITTILDVYDDAAVASSTNKIMYAKKIGGGSDTREKDTKLFFLSRLFHVKFKRLGGG